MYQMFFLFSSSLFNPVLYSFPFNANLIVELLIYKSPYFITLKKFDSIMKVLRLITSSSFYLKKTDFLITVLFKLLRQVGIMYLGF